MARWNRSCERDRRTSDSVSVINDEYVASFHIDVLHTADTIDFIKYSLAFLRLIKTAEAFEAVDWLADLPQRTWPQAGRR